jgi:hypothetical protein
MDADRFDEAVRSLVVVPSRRGMLGLTLGGSLSVMLGLADGVAKKKSKRKNTKKRKCLAGQRRCRDRRCHGCCPNADCGGNACVLGVCRDCPSNERLCRGGCIPETSCCTDDECDGQQTCISGVCSCRANERRCDGACMPVEYCCTSVDCAGAPCLNGQCQCGEGQQECRGECIPETSCCRTSDCSACERCENEACANACPAGQTCLDGVCACAERECDGVCIPNDGCCPACGDREVCSFELCICAPGTGSCGPLCCVAGAEICLRESNSDGTVTFRCLPGA